MNSSPDDDKPRIIANEFGDLENAAIIEELINVARGVEDIEKDHQVRWPVVAVMGHLGHGKTSLLDKIRSSRVAGSEAGSITQHISAYRVTTDKGTVVFIDTPGHEAFTAMRARSAELSDIVMLVIAADEGVMPQTREAIAHSKTAGVPIVVAINKMDKKAAARPEVVMGYLGNNGLLPEDWGGDVLVRRVSSYTGDGIDDLIESVLLQAELLELSANPNIPGEGTVLEAYFEKGRGPVANVLVRNGSLKSGDVVVTGTAWGEVKSITDDCGRTTNKVGPATPVKLLGLSDVPIVGESFYVLTDASKARGIAEQTKRVQGSIRSVPSVGRDEAHQASSDVQELKVIVKADVQGSIEALVQAISELSSEKLKFNIVQAGVGDVTENDLLPATASNCIVLGFNVRVTGKADEVAKAEHIDVRLCRVVDEVLTGAKAAMGALSPQQMERCLGKAEVRKIFSISKIGAIAGCVVTSGKLARRAKARVVREIVEIWTGDIKTLRRFKDDVREVATGYECGVGLVGFNDFRERDVIECFEMVQVPVLL